MMRWLWLAVGGTAMALAAIGLVLPLIPTVPFLLLAAFGFARSSDRLHGWLLAHPVLGPPIRDWQRNGAIGLRAKQLGTLSILAGFAGSVLFGLPAPILLVQGVILTAALAFIWSRPSR